MGYYPIPDIPADATPDGRRFCEQVRSVVASLEKFGQSFEVHLPFTNAAAAIATAPDDLDEFTVYRAASPVELLEAHWTTSVTGAVGHNMLIRRRTGDGVTAGEVVQSIRAASVNTTAWRAFLPKRFEAATANSRVNRGEILTLHIDDAGGATVPWGLLSLYFRRAEVS